LENYSESPSSVVERDALRKMVLLRWSVGAVGAGSGLVKYIKVHLKVHLNISTLPVRIRRCRAGSIRSSESRNWSSRAAGASLSHRLQQALNELNAHSMVLSMEQYGASFSHHPYRRQQALNELNAHSMGLSWGTGEGGG
jgi:hypothetical protein